jgi:hypothetical protein
LRNNVILFFAIVLGLSCQRDEDPGIGESFLKDNSYALVIDTVSFRTSTILMDSIKSSGGELILAGEMYDEAFGRIKANSYFQIGPPASVELADLDGSATFDSIFLELIYNGYYYGDTMSYQTIEVYALSEDIVANEDDGYLHNTSSFARQPGCLGRISYRPNPRSGGTERIRLSDEYGRALFELIKEEDDILSDQEDFLERFKGLTLTSGDVAGSCIVGFIAYREIEYDADADQSETLEDAAEIRILLRMYYHDHTPGSEEQEIEWNLVNEHLQFNQTVIDRTGTRVDTTLAEDQRLKSQSTDDLTFIQGGQPMMTCIEIPYIDNLRLTGDNGMLIYGGITVKPLKGSYEDPYRLPSTLNVWICNDDNELLSPLYTNTGDTVRSILYIDDEFDENTHYEIPVTTFLEMELNNDLITDYSLVLTLPTGQKTNSFERVILGGEDHPEQTMRLEIYYLFY